MMQLVLAALFSLLFLLTLAVRRVYYCVPAKELKRLARDGDHVGRQLYKAVAFDGSLAVLLWFMAGACAAASFVLLALALSPLVAALAMAIVLWTGFGWVASSFPRNFMVRFSAALSPAIAWVLSQAHPVLLPISRAIRSHHRVLDHTGLYEKLDLSELFAKQKAQLDSRVAPAEVELMERVLAFSEKTAGETIMPRKDVRLVRPDDTIGPKLLDELHQSGQTLFPVSDDAGKHMLGVVRLEDLVHARHGGTVASVANEAVHFVREDFSLQHVLDIFRKTKQQMLVAINNFEEFVGVVTLEGVLHELMGEQPALAQEDMYDDAAAVAAYQLPPEPEPVATEPEEVSAEEADELPAVDPGSIKQKDELVADNAAEPPLESSEASTESDQRATPDNQEVVE